MRLVRLLGPAGFPEGSREESSSSRIGKSTRPAKRILLARPLARAAGRGEMNPPARGGTGEWPRRRERCVHCALAVGSSPLSGARRIATLARSGQQACAGTCALRHHSRHNSAPALPPPSDDVCWGQSTPASSLIAREARLLAAASDLRRRLDRRWPRWRPT